MYASIYSLFINNVREHLILYLILWPLLAFIDAAYLYFN
ncbi:DUF2770 family protein [Cedecea colo]|uniref:DUF2770 domain-containing protein n=1 Tax=Cedecea colo TaxID=2552946 RepID=A0ABX0VJW7_9ENTR|nr:DUF2770 family protein [Cedecea colo]NIY46994.1 DUF2770 domain-containing protein [Cedecea colo]